MEALREIANRLKGKGNVSDKTLNVHNYVCKYECLLGPYRKDADKVVEVGLNAGASLRLWYYYFCKAHIYGLDIKLKRVGSMSPYGGRVSKHRVDQSSRKQLESFAKEHGPFDIIIDDGSHIWSHQILTFETLFPYVKEGGLYVIEDTDTSYEPEFAEGEITCVDYFKNIADELNKYGEGLWSVRIGKGVDRGKLTEHQRTIEWLMFSHTMLALKKRLFSEVPHWGA